MNKKIAALVVLVLLAALAAVLISVFSPKGANGAILDGFAKCLTEKGAAMYGAYWCPHCKNEKAAFGDSFKYINYIECTVKTDECTAKGVESFPTWIFPDGRKLVGEQGIAGLSKESGCVLPDGYPKS